VQKKENEKTRSLRKLSRDATRSGTVGRARINNHNQPTMYKEKCN